MVKGRHLEYMLFVKCQVCRAPTKKMASCVVNLVILAVLTRKALCMPSPGTDSTTTMRIVTTNTTDNQSIVEMGKGIEKIPRGKFQTKLLNLAYNHIQTLPDNIFHNNSYKALNQIELYQNKINSISNLAFRGLRQLTSVDLADNNLTSLDPYTFKFNPKLERLDLSNNRLNFNRLQVFLISHSLDTLIVSNNKIEAVYELTFVGLENLRNLVLDHNTLFLVQANSFKPLKELQYLSLANTGVYRLSSSMFEDLPRIINVQGTPLAKRFDPPLKKVTDNAVRSLINIDQYIFISDTPV